MYACRYHRHFGAYVCISHEAGQHLIIRLSSTLLSFICFVLASHPLLIFSLSRFTTSQTPPPPPRRPPPHCLSLPLLLPNALHLTTLFPFKIKIIKSEAKWEKLCCWRHHGSTLMFYFCPIVSTSCHHSQTTVVRAQSQLCTCAGFRHSCHLLYPPSHLLLLLLYTQRQIWHAKLYCLTLGPLSCHPTTAFFSAELTHLSFLFPSLSSLLSFLILCCSLPLSFSCLILPFSRLLGNCAPLI